MNPIRREMLNGLFVLVVASLLSVAFAEFQLSFNLQIWVLILMAIAIAVTGYVVFEFALKSIASTEEREKEWLKRVGTPARLEMNQEGAVSGITAVAETLKALGPGSDYTVMYYFEGGVESVRTNEVNAIRDKHLSLILERLKHGTLREYKRIICFDHDELANDQELKSGVLRVGKGPGTIDRAMGEHCRLMLETKGCSLYVAPALLRFIVSFYGVDKASIALDAADQKNGGRGPIGVIFFCDPPNGEIIEQFRQMERATERRMVAVHKIVFPEDEAPVASLTARLPTAE
jgi:hypothetical protein